MAERTGNLISEYASLIFSVFNWKLYDQIVSNSLSCLGFPLSRTWRWSNTRHRKRSCSSCTSGCPWQSFKKNRKRCPWKACGVLFRSNSFLFTKGLSGTYTHFTMPCVISSVFEQFALAYIRNFNEFFVSFYLSRQSNLERIYDCNDGSAIIMSNIDIFANTVDFTYPSCDIPKISNLLKLVSGVLLSQMWKFLLNFINLS